MRGKVIVSLFLMGLFWVSVFPNSISLLGLNEDPSGTISGVVTESNGVTPIVGALVEAFQQGDLTVSSTTTVAGGIYSLPLPVGAYKLRVSAKDRINAIKPVVNVTADTTTTVNFNLSLGQVSILDEFTGTSLNASTWNSYLTGIGSLGISNATGELTKFSYVGLSSGYGGAGSAAIASKRNASVGSSVVFEGRMNAYVEGYAVYGDKQPRGLRAGTDANNAIEFISYNGATVQARTVASGNATTTNYNLGFWLSTWNVYRIEANSSIAKFYVNGVLVATHTANIPTIPLNIYMGTSYDGYGNVPVSTDYLYMALAQATTLTISATADGTTNPSPGIYMYPVGSSAQVTAIPIINHVLDHWELDGANIGAANPISVTMDIDHTLHAVTTVRPPITEWARTYGGTSSEHAMAVVQAGDGGYAMAGGTYEFSSTEPDGWLVRTDKDGDMLWNRTYGGADYDELMSIVCLGDGGFALAGHTRSYGDSFRYLWLVRTDVNGNVLWNRTYGGSTYDLGYALIQTSDGGFALVGQSGGDAVLVKTDSAGHAQWNRTYGGIYTDSAYSIVQTPDDGYALAGYERSYIEGWMDFWLIRTDSTGNMLWNQTYGWTGRDELAYSMVRTADEGYLLAGETTSSYGAEDANVWLVRTDSTGNMLWNRTYGGGRDHAYSIVQAADGGYTFSGYTRSFGAGATDFWLVKISPTGDVQWSKTCGGPNEDYVHCFVQTSDGGYAMAGGTNSYGAGSWDYWLVKVAPEIHDVAIVNITLAQTLVEQGNLTPINVTVENQGDYPETFNVTTYCNSTVIETQAVNNLAESNQSTLTFNWNTTGIPLGNYTISANASIVTYETDTADNTFTDSTVRIGLLSYLERQVVALINGSRAYDYDLDLENIAYDHDAFRSSGSTGANETANWIKEQFEGFGLEAWLEPFEFTTWDLASKPSLIIDDDGNPTTTYDQTAITSFQCEQYSWPTSAGGAFADLVILPLPEAADIYELNTKTVNMTEWNAIDTTGRILLIGREVIWCLDGRQAFIDKITAQPPTAIVRTWWYDWMSFVPDFFGSAGGRPYGSAIGPYYWDLQIPTGSVSHEDGLWIKNRENAMNVSSRVTIRAAIDTGSHCNVVGKIGGYRNPEKIMIISAHYDTIMSSGFCDNGAGVAGMIEIARVLKNMTDNGLYRPSYTLLFVAFAGEELGLVGSINYVKQHKSEMANIIAVINLDSIGSDELHIMKTNPANGFDLDNVILDAAQDLGIAATFDEPDPYTVSSDQDSFRIPSVANDTYKWNWGLESGIADAVPVNSSTVFESYPLLYYDKWNTGTPGYIHTSYDNSTSTETLDWVQEEDLENAIKVAALTIVRVSPTSPAQIIQTTVTIEGEDYIITTESNATIANAAATRTTLDFTISGLTGQTAYVNTTLPMGLNKTEIKVFIDSSELVPPPFPTIASNGTHYLVYFEFTLSTHNITIRYARADIATTNITSAKTVLGQGFTTSINATIQNQGDREETFNVTLCANTTSLASQNVTLSSGNSTTITLLWNCTGFARGNYTIYAYAWPVPDETNTDNNNCTGSWVVVAGVGDLTGGTPNAWDFVPDGKVDIVDVATVAKCFGQKVPPAPGNCDVSGSTIGMGDGKIDITDVATVAKHFGEHYP